MIVSCVKLIRKDCSCKNRLKGVFGVEGIAVFNFDVGYSVISLKWCGISVLGNFAVNGFQYIEAWYAVLPEKLWNFRMSLM